MCRLNNDETQVIKTIVNQQNMISFRERDARRKQLWDDLNKYKEAS